jgi:hypothetical protein
LRFRRLVEAGDDPKDGELVEDLGQRPVYAETQQRGVVRPNLVDCVVGGEFDCLFRNAWREAGVVVDGLGQVGERGRSVSEPGEDDLVYAQSVGRLGQRQGLHCGCHFGVDVGRGE